MNLTLTGFKSSLRARALCACLVLLTALGQFASADDGAAVVDVGILTWMQYQGFRVLQQIEDVEINGFSVDRPEVTVPAGTKVVFHNQDDTAHRLAIPLGNNDHQHEVRSGLIKPGKRWVVEFVSPGLYQYHCTIHPELEGLIYVEY